MEMDDHSGVIDVSGAKILGGPDSRSPPIVLPCQPAAASPMVALDIGGSLIKLVYTASRSDGNDGVELRFVTFERRRLDDCFKFLRAEGLINSNIGMPSSAEKVMLKATGGGTYKFANKFQEKLGVFLDKVDELESMVSGANFLLKNIPRAAFTHRNGMKSTVDINPNNLFPYLLVTVGTGVVILKVTGNKNFEIVTGTNISGATVFGLAKLLIGCKRIPSIKPERDNFILDSNVKDVCGEAVCQKEGLSMSDLAYSFGKVITSNKNLTDYKPEDLASTLLTAFTCNISQEGISASTLVSSFGKVITSNKKLADYKSEDLAAALLCAFTYNVAHEVPHESKDNDIFPHLFVNIGPGVSMIEVSGKGKFKTMIRSRLGGGTILGLAKLLMGCSSYEEFLELSQKGNSLSIDLTIMDTFGESCHECGIPASCVFRSFGRVHSSKLSEYNVEDISASLLNCFVYNTGQIVYLMTKILGLKRIFFHGAFICGHETIMDDISRFLEHRLKNEVQVMFIHHERFLEPFGTFSSCENMGIDGFVGYKDIREVFLCVSYIEKFQSLAQQNKHVSNNFLSCCS